MIHVYIQNAAYRIYRDMHACIQVISQVDHVNTLTSRTLPAMPPLAQSTAMAPFRHLMSSLLGGEGSGGGGSVGAGGQRDAGRRDSIAQRTKTLLFASSPSMSHVTHVNESCRTDE